MNMNRLIYFFASGFLACNTAFSADWYVATNGSDTASGTLEAPFATVQKAAEQMVAGDTCYIRGGTYHQEAVVTQLVGSEADPITFTNYEDERVLFDGTIPITTSWTPYKGDVYQTTITEDVWQLFIDGQMMINCRWPNINLGDNSIFMRIAYWARGNDAQSTTNTMVDTAIDSNRDLAASGLDLTGAMGILNVQSFETRPREIVAHEAGSNTFEFNPVPGIRGSLWYYAECKLDLLDVEGEWFFDATNKTLYVDAPGIGAPTGAVRGKNQAYAMDFAGCDYVVVDGLNFFATTVKFYNSRNCTLQNSDFDYPSFSRRMLGSESNIEITKLRSGTNSQDGNTVYNCSFENSDGSALELKGKNPVIENNYFRNIDFSCAGIPGLGVGIRHGGGYDALYRRNTIENFGASSAIGAGNRAITELNHIWSYPGTQLQNDGACIHRMNDETPNSITRYNWMHDTVKYTARFDGNPAGKQGLVHHNVVWNAGTMRIKGNEHQIYNNSGYKPRGSKKGNINIATDKHPTPNVDSITLNNVADLISATPIPGTASNNWSGQDYGLTVESLMRDPANLDFRPQGGSALVDGGVVVAGINDDFVGAQPDIGAYEYGDAKYWIPGRKWKQASTPIPPDGATGVKPDADLMWLEALDGQAHHVYFGTNATALAFMGSQTNNIFDPGDLSVEHDYFWRIDAVTPTGTVTGEVWRFDLGVVPAFNSDPIEKPAASYNQGYSDSLAGDAIDPDGDTVVFSKLSGPAWLTVAPDGTLGGTPGLSDLGWNSFTVLADDQDEGAIEGTVRIEVNAGSFLVDSTVVFHADFQGSETTNLLPLSQAERNAVLGNGWSDLGAMPELLYEVAEDEAGNKVLVFAIEKSSSTTVPVAYGDFGSVVDFSSNTTLVVDWEWMHTDKSGGGNGYAFFELLDTNGAAITSVKWTDNGQILLDGTEVTAITRQLPVDEAEFGGLTSANWNPLPMQLIMTGGSIELSVNGVVVSHRDGAYSHAAGIRLKCLSSKTWSDGGMWIDNISAEAGQPSAETYYAKWGSDHDLAGAADYHDNPDGDALDNLAEYALGSNPAVAADPSAFPPTFRNMEYVYPRRIDHEARGLIYTLQGCANLISNDWKAFSNLSASTAPLESGFEAVTNQISTAGTNRFIRLRISID